jgi:tetratricopeptide (TPR) repeat protein
MYCSSLVHRVFGLALPLTLLATSAYSQQAPASPAPASPAPGQGQGGPTQGNPNPQQPGQQPGRQPTFPGRDQQQQQQQMEDMMRNRPIMLSGKVMMEDGTPPPELVLIERVCNGIARPEGYTDSKGRFSFQLGQNQSILADASNGSDMGIAGRDMGGVGGRGIGGMNRGISEHELMGCEIRAQLPGFRSTIVQLAGRRALDNPDVGTMILQRLAKVDGFTFSATTGMAPKDARKAYEKGLNAVKKKKLDEAEAEYRKAVAAYPKYAVAWYELGRILQFKKNTEEARKAFDSAIEADAKYINPYGDLARLAAMDKKWDDAAANSLKLIKLNPYVSPDAYFISGIAHLNLQKLDVAEEHTREALKRDEKHQNPKIYQLLAVILAQKQDIPGAAEQLRAYVKLAPNAPDIEQLKAQLADMEKQLASREGQTQVAQ